MLKSFVGFITLLISFSVFAQDISDVLKYSLPSSSGSINSMAMGYSNTTFGEDITPLFANPAALGFIKSNQFGLSLALTGLNTESNFNQNNIQTDYSKSGFNQMGFVLPIDVYKGSLVMGFGFTQLKSFDELSKGSGLNMTSSYAEGITGFDKNVRPTVSSSDLSDRLNNLYFEFAFEAFLIDTVRMPNGTFRYRTPVFGGNTNQEYSNITEGYMDSWSGAISFEAAKDIFIGISANFITGSSNNSYKWSESAYGNFYDSRPDSGIKIGTEKFTFNKLEMKETYNDELTGYSVKIGSIIRLNQNFRLGMSLTLPSSMTINSKYSYDLVGYYKSVQTGTISSFANPSGKYSDKVSYNITSPSIIEMNIGYIGFPFQAEVGMSTINWSNTKLVSNDNLMDFNKTNELLKFNGKRVFNYRAGIQYAIPVLTSFVRAGVLSDEMMTPDFKSKYQLTYTCGWEYVVSQDTKVMLGYSLQKNVNNYTAYTPSPTTGKAPLTYNESVTNQNLLLGTTINF